MVVVAVAVALYVGGWWLHEDSTNRGARINRRSYEVQKSYLDKARDYIVDADADGVTSGQRINIVRRACDLINDLTIEVPSDVANFAGKECS